jgi:hypothetical protein
MNMEKQLRNWEKISGSHTFDNGLISKIYKEHNSIARKQISPLKWVKNINRHFFKRRNINSQRRYEKNVQ